MKNGLMIVCDGSNGAGKTTVIKAIEQYLLNAGHQVVLTREPGGTPIGEKLREIILSNDTPEMGDLTELMLFGAARAQHLQEKIIPALAQGKIVISDRFDAATLSFQHYARGLDLSLVTRINDLAINGFSPDQNIILDLDPIEGLKRVHSRGEGLDRLEDQDIAFLNRARQGYLTQARQKPELFTVVDAAQTLDKVIADVLVIIEKLVNDLGL